MENQLALVDFIFFIFPRWNFEFNFNPWCKIEWPPGHLDNVFVLKKNRPEKFSFIATNNWIVLAVRFSYSFLLWVPRYSRKNMAEKQKT